MRSAPEVGRQLSDLACRLSLADVHGHALLLASAERHRLRLDVVPEQAQGVALHVERAHVHHVHLAAHDAPGDSQGLVEGEAAGGSVGEVEGDDEHEGPVVRRSEV